MIVDARRDGSGRFTGETAIVIGVPPTATGICLARLVQSSLSGEIGTGPQDSKRRYFAAGQLY
jgi:hypothetical protein